jgi:NAD(P)-dependent dehydrogenase (short-subunit alcohol dehydrogenase family)
MTRTILITGCSSGIGRCAALGMRERGWRVFATARRPEDISALAAAGVESLYLDYAEEPSIAAAAEDVLAATGGTLDALFNNGAYSQPGAIEDLPTHALRAQFDANFFGWHELTRRIVPVMRRQGSGRIIMNSSILGFIALGFRAAYNCTKFAVEAYADTLRIELAGAGVRVSVIQPGPIRTNIGKTAARPCAEEHRHREFRPPRLLSPADRLAGARRRQYARRARAGGGAEGARPRLRIAPPAPALPRHHADQGDEPRGPALAEAPAPRAAPAGDEVSWPLAAWLAINVPPIRYADYQDHDGAILDACQHTVSPTRYFQRLPSFVPFGASPMLRGSSSGARRSQRNRNIRCAACGPSLPRSFSAPRSNSIRQAMPLDHRLQGNRVAAAGAKILEAAFRQIDVFQIAEIFDDRFARIVALAPPGRLGEFVEAALHLRRKAQCEHNSLRNCCTCIASFAVPDHTLRQDVALNATALQRT